MIIRWTKPSAADLTHICGYTEKRFGAAQARHAAMAIYEAADTLKDMPLFNAGVACPAADHVPNVGAGKSAVAELFVLPIAARKRGPLRSSLIPAAAR